MKTRKLLFKFGDPDFLDLRNYNYHASRAIKTALRTGHVAAPDEIMDNSDRSSSSRWSVSTRMGYYDNLNEGVHIEHDDTAFGTQELDIPVRNIDFATPDRQSREEKKALQRARLARRKITGRRGMVPWTLEQLNAYHGRRDQSFIALRRRQAEERRMHLETPPPFMIGDAPVTEYMERGPVINAAEVQRAVQFHEGREVAYVPETGKRRVYTKWYFQRRHED